MKSALFIILLKVILSASVRKEICEQCLAKEQCPSFTSMNRQEQITWNLKFPCDEQQDKKNNVFGFSPVAKGDLVCCKNSQVWGVNNLGTHTVSPAIDTDKTSNSSDPAIKPEYGNLYDQPNRRNPYLYGNQNNPNMYGNQQYPDNPYGGEQNYPNQNMYGNQNMPNNQNGYGRQPGYGNPGNFGNQGRFPGYLGNQFPDNQNTFDQPGGFGQNGRFPPSQNLFGGMQNRPSQNLGGQFNRPTNQYPYGGQQNRPNPNPYTNPQYGNRPSYPGSSINGFPWGNQRNPGYQRFPHSHNQAGILNPGQNNIIPGYHNNKPTNIPGQEQPGAFNPGLNTPGNENNFVPDYQNPQSNILNPGITNPGLPLGGIQNNIVPGYQDPQSNVPKQLQPGLNTELPSTINQNPPYQSNPNQNENSYGNDRNDHNPDLEAECNRMKTSYPPSPETGCCGRDMSDAETVTDLQSLLNMFAPPKQNWNQPRYSRRPHNRPSTSWPTYQRRKRATQNDTDLSLDNRIAGGRETDLDQFPWTVLMKTTFDYGTKVSAFSCGGSLISRRYVLTAGHCVFEPKARISDVEVTLAEYDKRTFPIDCITVFGGGRQCVKNVLMHAEDVIHHPEYDDDRLLNDIALVRLNAFAPYTRFIRPVCLPNINIDIPEFSNLPLAVAGWGRDHQYLTDVKQSTVVQLVPPEDCKKSYPHLSKKHLCAAGRTGQDTCKGDSGGPLMMLYKGSYYIIGIVSGKRADSPCGSKVPSLYTNVYQYISWIQNTIRE
ncbi:probable cyclin-dependent serine/threonine-protein kinase DDB_G0292550 [Pieris rapae]|uniref:probable cyclin-dependent serine/threonine-protein kinase DDB_G0292550 n=1 Tax=Pieris rapae TaxID=64459 RepID=UPI001E27F1AA|nr:probable cyclin-dependent serine/threonine-protein kinase DDB_G0292550 [Pieris rapae]